jgi:hypothetical protein
LTPWGNANVSWTKRLRETKKLYGAPSEKCCICGGMSITALYVKDDPRPVHKE